MPTLVFDPQPAELEELVARRRQLDQDRRDEVWEGVLHMIPPPSVEHERIASVLHRALGPFADASGLVTVATIGIGTGQENYRVPDLALLRAGFKPQWNETAALVVEIVSPDDKSWEKLPFYAAHHVDEVVIVEPEKRAVHWLRLAGGEYEPLESSQLLGVGPSELALQLNWRR
jgi:Uma2 family endonuclease